MEQNCECYYHHCRCKNKIKKLGEKVASFANAVSAGRFDSTFSFDLHGHKRQEALEAVKGFFKRAKEEQFSSMTIITGRGNHRNPNGTRGVLYHSLPKWLELPEIKNAIKEVRTDMGAYKIILKNEEQEKRLESLQKVVEVADQFFFSPEQVEVIREKAAEGSPSHQYILGGLMINGTFVEKDLVQGVKLVESAANAGDHFAQMQMGFLYGLGCGVQQDYQLSRKWHLKASENNAQPYSLYVLGTYFWLGEGVIKDDERAIGYLLQAASLGVHIAAHNLGKSILKEAIKQSPMVFFLKNT